MVGGGSDRRGFIHSGDHQSLRTAPPVGGRPRMARRGGRWRYDERGSRKRGHSWGLAILVVGGDRPRPLTNYFNSDRIDLVIDRRRDLSGSR